MWKPIIALLTLGLAFTYGGGFGHGDVCAKAKKLQEICDRPVCKCDELDKCIEGKKEQMMAAKKQCMEKCATEAPVTSANMEQLMECKEGLMEKKKAKMEEVKNCFIEKLGRCCDDGTGVTELPVDTEDGPPRHHGKGDKSRGKRRGGRRMHRVVMKFLMKVLPKDLTDHFECVMDCLHENRPPPPGPPPPSPPRVKRGGRRGGRRGRGPPGMHHVMKMMKKHCMEELKCRKARTHTFAEKKAAMEECHPKMDGEEMIKKLMGYMKEKCACGNKAGLSMNCDEQMGALEQMLHRGGSSSSSSSSEKDPPPPGGSEGPEDPDPEDPEDPADPDGPDDAPKLL